MTIPRMNRVATTLARTDPGTTTGTAPTRPALPLAPGVTLPSRKNVAVVRQFDVFHAREAAAAMATRIGFSRPAAYRLATAVSELGNNLLDHARTGGRVELMPISRDGVQGIEVVVEDDGPGIADREMAMTDGFSTDRGLGGGLGGCRRLVDEFALESSVGKGTRVTARLWLRKSPRITGPERQCGGTVPPVGADLAQGGGQPVPDADPGRPPCKAHHDGHGPVSSDPDRASPDAVGRLRRTAVARRSSR